jgi:hypothetical protein
MKVLFGWQLGGGQGHIQRLVALAQGLESYGVEPIFALKSYDLKMQRFGWKTLLAPPLQFPVRSESYSYADILETFGFGDADFLRSHLAAWKALLIELKPNLVIADHAPGLVLAARGIVPIVVVGDGFAVPPPVDIFPILRFPTPPEVEHRQERVNNIVHQVMELDIPLGQALNGERHFIFSIPELDPYRYLRLKDCYVSIHIAPLSNGLHDFNGSIWAYLGEDYTHRNLVLQMFKPECEFKPLDQALARKSLAIHHAGLTTSIACLLTGIPQLALPRHLEQYLNALALSQLGVAVLITNPNREKLLIAQNQAYGLIGNVKQKAIDLIHWNQNHMQLVIDVCLKFLAESMV